MISRHPRRDTVEDDDINIKRFSTREDTVGWLKQNMESGERARQAIGIFGSILHPSTVDAVLAMQLGGFTPEETLDALAYHYINTAANIQYRADGFKEDAEILKYRGKFAEIAIIRAASMASGLGMDWEERVRTEDHGGN